MNPGVQPDPQGEPSPGGGLAFGDVLFIVFRHKLLILGSIILGLIAAGLMRLQKPPAYESTAKIYLPYVVKVTAINPKDSETAIHSTDTGADAILNTEVEMLKSFDTAIEVADKIGPEKILEKYGGGTNRLAAAGVVASGIVVLPPRTMSLTVTFSHRDAELVQPILTMIIKAYMHRHHGLSFGDTGLFADKAREAVQKMTELDGKLRALRTAAGVPDIRERQAALKREYDRLQTQVLQAQTELSARKAELGEVAKGWTNQTANPLSPDTISSYSVVLDQIEEIKRRQRMLLLDDLTTNHPSVVKLEVKLQEQIRARTGLERAYPNLTNYLAASPRMSGSTNGPARIDLEAELATLERAERTIKSDQDTLVQLRDESFRLMELEPKLTELERQHELAEKDYIFYQANIDKAKTDEKASGGVVNMQEMQAPTPPRLDTKKLFKLMGMAFCACVGLGLGIAFLMDLILDRTIRRPMQIVRNLRLPVLLTIPDMNRKAPSLLPWTRRNRNVKVMRPDKNGTPNTANAIAPWSPDNQLQTHIEGLRERVITHFEVRNLEAHPKLVALTACGESAGVTTLASGLAASLSRTGNGTVLLVDMNQGEGVTHSFYRGKPGYGPSEPIDAEAESGGEAAAAKGTKLSLTKVQDDQRRRDRLAGILPPGFNGVAPKLKADAYDYVVFDMTCISPASVTPRMSGHMDLVLFVIESEKTRDHSARYASGLMRESRANVAAILNKYYNPVPPWLAHD